MEYLIGLLVLAFGAILFLKDKVDSARIDALLGKTKRADDDLKKDQAEVEKNIREMDESIAKIKAEREKKQEDKTRDERADEWNNT